MTDSISETIDDGGPAFPLPDLIVEGHVVCGSRGMSLRDWFAGLAMQQLIHRREMVEGETYAKPELAAECFHYADVMLNEREKTQC